jgi:hypothetical protein
MKRCVAVWLAGALLLGAAGPVLAETVLEKIKRTGVLTAGTRGNNIPLLLRAAAYRSWLSACNE